MSIQAEFPPTDTAARDIYTVSRLNREARAVLEGSFPLIWLEGEVSNLARPSSGHLYFSLKDEAAQVRCAMFRSRCANLRFRPDHGQHVLVRARISLYEGRGEFQLIVEHMEEAGFGALQSAFEALKQRLSVEGLFDPARKRPIPVLPRRIGVITSPTGAAIRDILSILGRRFPSAQVVVYPVPVQGAGAAARIAEAIATADRRCECDVLILARGGGSLEDLWAFNEEVVARAIAACQVPLVTGVGHEVDVTIADFAADLRAPTPSAAAEAVVPDVAEWLHRLGALRGRLQHGMRGKLEQEGKCVHWLHGRLQQQHPGARLQQHGQRLDELEHRRIRAQRQLLGHLGVRLEHVKGRLRSRSPLVAVQTFTARTGELERRLARAVRQQRAQHEGQLRSVVRALQGVSPLATLERGYAIVTDQDGRILRRAGEVRAGDPVEARLARGRLRCTVERIEED